MVIISLSIMPSFKNYRSAKQAETLIFHSADGYFLYHVTLADAQSGEVPV